jgi:preprotein translocase subunit SecD
MIQLPGITDVQAAKELIGKTAKLDFREQITKDGVLEWAPAKAIGSDGTEKALTGKYFKPNAQVVFSSEPGQQGRPQVAFELHGDGPKLFEQITTRLVGQPLGIFLDDQLVSDPIVQSVLRDGGVITFSSLTPGSEVLKEARTLAIQLNAGALPVPISIVQEQAVDATLGSDSIRKSILAGEVGLGIVLLFMVVYYRLPGLLASCALVTYALLVLAVFKLWPVTLTLAGIAAFILSIGMAVDANILIFERMKEEFRAGRTLGAAIEAGFARAWTSIRDSNVSTMITCAILFWFGSNFGASMVTGFAVTLFFGVIVSMFTAIMVTRTFLRLFIGSRWASNAALFGVAGMRRPQG